MDRGRVDQLREAVDSALGEALEAEKEIDGITEEWREIVSNYSAKEAENIIEERNIFQRAKEARRKRDKAWKKHSNLFAELTWIIRP